jgi:tRNA threonylcarbamoyladenosine biosynthesis protein TsaE
MGAEIFVDSRSPDETRSFGSSLGEEVREGDVIALQGPLGAGKTCLVQGIAEGLGVDPEVPVTSPTFTLVGEYPGRVLLRHADFYRVENSRRLDDAGFRDLLDGKGILVVEWADRFPETLPEERLEIRIEFRSECERRLTLRAYGSVAEERLRRMQERWR